MSGPVPEWLLSGSAAITVFTVMLGVGLGTRPGDLHWVWQRRGLMARGLFAVLVAAPALALAITSAFELPRLAEIGIVLMAIAPGAPVALRRSLAAGGHRAFAPSLQVGVAILAVVSMPLSIAALNHVYAGRWSVTPSDVARQVFVAQLLPLGLGLALRHANGLVAARLEPRLARFGTILLAIVFVLVLVDAWEGIAGAGLRAAAAMAFVTGAALAAGHLLGGTEHAVRTTVAISTAVRNAGLALLVATLNGAPPGVNATILAHAVIAVLVTAPYVAWRRRAARPA